MMAFDFPVPTKELVTRLAAEITATSGTSRTNRAEGLYRALSGKFDYDFGEGIAQGLFIRWPHEIKKAWECIEAGTYTYAVAEALGLEPRMMRVGRWRRFDTGHDTIDVAVEHGRVLVDPLNSMFGTPTYTARSIVVEDNDLTERCELPCTRITEVSRDLMLRCIEFYRSDEGISALLTAGQIAANREVGKIFIAYEPDKRVLEFQYRTSLPFVDPAYESQRFALGRQGVRHAVRERGVYAAENWKTLEGREVQWKKIVNFRAQGKDREKMDFPKLGPRSARDLLQRFLYGELLGRKHPESPCDNPSGYYLFDDHDLPLRRVEDLLAKFIPGKIPPADKAAYHDLRDTYLKLINWHQSDQPALHTLLDYVTFFLLDHSLAAEQGWSHVNYVEVMRRLGIDVETFAAFRYSDAIDIKESPLDVFIRQHADAIVARVTGSTLQITEKA